MQHEGEAHDPPSGDRSASETEDFELPDLTGIDFSQPDACNGLKEEHEQCFYDWMKRFTRGEVKKDECQIPWKRYQYCVAVSSNLFTIKFRQYRLGK